jgi:hypothetical protein
MAIEGMEFAMAIDGDEQATGGAIGAGGALAAEVGWALAGGGGGAPFDFEPENKPETALEIPERNPPLFFCLASALNSRALSWSSSAWRHRSSSFSHLSIFTFT